MGAIELNLYPVLIHKKYRIIQNFKSKMHVNNKIIFLIGLIHAVVGYSIIQHNY